VGYVGVVDDLSDGEVRAEIRRFERLGADLSYRRRVLQGRLDILVANGGVLPERANLAELTSVLAVSGRRKLPAMCLGTASSEIERLSREERVLSRRRRVAYAMVDILRAERVCRLRHPSVE
jgi:NAD(P)-dependent dehydrogenase (short-subunit alcohol dehydrogenase family)